ncbi:hypothetical protein [Methylobacterium isbiliense]|jgi:hypothetical protein|uniref:Secreted protein n=1 Tax=Methylobacterium isbiliense TaxID=315478 RepID=A0ABQ4S7Q4_9HYPH|nr:hypothetical protein [Methylobacterium isbiliense]MDN3623494.1 hypothetical protein [Methylobacterium isbiliense]GJD99216.1 hypothetical protein GMJLKIPL_1132 [Methylobacterium isbiliense]
MTSMIRHSCLVLGMMGAVLLAQAVDTPQKSREQAPNIPAPDQTVPERLRTRDPGATGTTTPHTHEDERTAPSNAGAQRS